MKDICPNCEKQSKIQLVKKEENINVRGESISVEIEFFRCLECNEEFIDAFSDNNLLKAAYREYRKRHNIMQPEDIKELRNFYGLTQNEMSKLLGWGGATLSRYENGALQDQAHAKLLSLIKEPHNFLKLLQDNPEAVHQEKRENLINDLTDVEKVSHSIERIYEENFGTYAPDELSGFKKFNLEKFYNAILYFCLEGCLKTVLLKHIFYADFKNFKENIISITGARYKHYQYGPVPENYPFYLASLEENGFIQTEEILYSNNCIGEKYISIKEPNLLIFSDIELNTLTYVKHYFKDFNASQIKKLSHNEKGYQETDNNEIISYKFAEDLQI